MLLVHFVGREINFHARVKERKFGIVCILVVTFFKICCTRNECLTLRDQASYTHKTTDKTIVLF